MSFSSAKKLVCLCLPLLLLTSRSAHADLTSASSATSLKLRPHPTKVSLLIYEGSEIQGEQFGHTDLRFSYGSELSAEDRVVGFGPTKNLKFATGPLAYLGIGGQYPMIYWNQTFQERYEEASRVRMVRVTNLVLDLALGERNHVAALINKIFEEGYGASYNLITRNCATTITHIIGQASNIPRRPFSFLPLQLEKNWIPFSTKRQVFESGRDLKRSVLKKNGSLYEKLFSKDLERRVFEKQLFSMRTETRALAYRTLHAKGAHALADALLAETEVENRRDAILQTLNAPNHQGAKRLLKLGPHERFNSLKVEGNKVVITSTVAIVGSRRSAKVIDPATRTVRRELSFDELGLSSNSADEWTVGQLVERKDSYEKIYLWITPNLGLDAI